MQRVYLHKHHWQGTEYFLSFSLILSITVSQCWHATSATWSMWHGTAATPMMCLALRQASQLCWCMVHWLAGSACCWRQRHWQRLASGAAAGRMLGAHKTYTPSSGPCAAVHSWQWQPATDAYLVHLIALAFSKGSTHAYVIQLSAADQR